MVIRDRLIERALVGAPSILAIIAPAGFGKTVLATQIVAAAGRPGIHWDAAFASPTGADGLENAWSGAPSDAIVVFDSLETLVTDAAAIAALTAVIRAPGRRTVILCARPPFALLNTRALPPGTYRRFGPEHLRFDTADSRAALVDADDARRATIHEETGGWPFAEIALNHGTMADVSEYVYVEVVSNVPDDLRPLLAAVTAVGSGGTAAIAQVVSRSDVSNAAQQLAAIVPMTLEDGGRVALDPLLARVVERRFAEEVARMRATLAMRTFAERSRTMAPPELFAEVKRIRESLPAGTETTALRTLDGYLAFFALEAGEIEYAEAVLAPHLETISATPATSDEAIILAAQGRLSAERYQIEPAIAHYEHALPYIENPSMSASIAARLAFLKLLQGDDEVASALAARATGLARRSGQALTMLDVLMQVALNAWLFGDEIEYGRHIALFEEESGAEAGVLRSFGEAIRAKSTERLDAALPPRWRAYAALIVAGEQSDPGALEATLQWANREAILAADPVAEFLSLLALSIAIPARRDELQGPISALSLRIPAPALRESLESFFSGGDGGPILARFVRRWRSSDRVAIEGTASGTLRVNVLAGTVSHGDRVLKLSNRPLALVLTLAAMGSLSRERLCEMLWPDADDISAANTLKMCVRRARQQIDDPTAIVFERSLWALREDIVVDIVEIERNLRVIPSAGALSGTNKSYLESLFEYLEKLQPAEIFNSEGMEGIGLRVNATRHNIVIRLGDDALQREDVPAALHYADVLRRWDPTDEAAYMLAIRAYAAAGNDAEAYREYRLYCVHCERELGIKPKINLDSLLKRTPAPT